MKKIIKIVTFYDDGTFTESTPSAPYSAMPYVPLNPSTAWDLSHCAKCGIKLESAMGYVCNNNPCPCGMGGVTC